MLGQPADMKPKSPVVIAHRGASGYLPEHTREAKVLAHAQGADFLEQDVVATADGELVVLHDICLEAVTDVAARFPRRNREDGHYYVIDFTLAEIRTLRVVGRRRIAGPENLDREPLRSGGLEFRVSTLAEEIELIHCLNRSLGRSAGLYAEIKEPQWHAAHGVDLGRLLVERLADYGYRRADDAAFVQCFDESELQRLRAKLGTQLKLVQLIDRLPHGGGPSPADVSRYAQGLGTPYRLLVEAPSQAAEKIEPSRFAREARAAGLWLHPFTFRCEDLPPYASNLDQLLEIFYWEIGVDGVFCDFPDIAVRVRSAGAPGGTIRAL
jgi:glycerophosphoryl diester phosphodiesterase